jgi:type I restriction enzyme S subunit
MDTKKLRQKILDLAIHGKLVAQNPNDEPASELLKRINPKAEIISNSEQYENLPNGWCLTLYKNIVKNVNSKAYQILQSEIKVNGKYPVISQSSNYIEGYSNCTEKVFQCKEAIIFGDHTRNVKFINFPFIVGADGVKILQTQFYYKYIYYFTIFSSDNLIENKGYSRHFGQLSSLEIPLPPLAEQKRIVEAIDKWFALIDSIENNKADLESTIKQTKSKILDLAIHGKLVAQNPNDEPASELLKRINPKAEITCDNGQYKNLPNGWQKTILGELFEHNTGKALNSSNQEGIIRDYLTTSNVYWDTFDLSIIKKMHFKENELGKCTVTKGDLLVCEGGDVGRSAIWNFDYDICIQNHLHRLRPKTELSVRFYYYVLKYLKDNNMIGGKGIGLLGLSSKELHKLPFPLPPLEEQKRIVEAIDKAFKYLDAIAESL